MGRKSFLQAAITRLRYSRLRRLLAPVEALLGPVLKRRGRILAGPMKGLRFPGGERGTLLGNYELPVQRALLEYLKEGQVCYDVGANTGYFSLLASVLVGARGHVYSFEPLPPNIAQLRETMTLNRVENHTLVGKAVSNAAGAVRFWTGDGNPRRASLIPWKGDRHVDIETVTLDDFTREGRWPDMIKVDVEGAETLVLEGASDLLSSDRPITWIIEIHDLKNEQTAPRLLEDHGYTTRLLPPTEVSERGYSRRHLVAWKALS